MLKPGAYGCARSKPVPTSAWANGGSGTGAPRDTQRLGLSCDLYETTTGFCKTLRGSGRTWVHLVHPLCMLEGIREDECEEARTEIVEVTAVSGDVNEMRWNLLFDRGCDPGRGKVAHLATRPPG